MDDFRLVFVGGIGRSGSTLIERLLGELPGACSIGEIVHLWRRSLVDDEPCGCGVSFAACGFWQEIGREAFGGWNRLDARQVLALKASIDRTRFVPHLLRSHPPAALAERLARYTELYDRLYTAVARVSGCTVLVDASKHASLAACLRHRYGSRMRVVHVVRDPRAVAYSWGKRLPRPAATATSLEQEMARYSPAQASMHWMTQNAVFASLARRGVPTLRVRYEDFVADPVEEFRAIAAFVGHDADDAGQDGGHDPNGGLDHGAAGLPVGDDQRAWLSSTHAVSGNPRLGAGTLTVAADTAWRGDLARRDRVMVSALTAPARWRYGY